MRVVRLTSKHLDLMLYYIRRTRNVGEQYCGESAEIHFAIALTSLTSVRIPCDSGAFSSVGAAQ